MNVAPSCSAGGGAGAVEGGLTETLVWRSRLHSNIGGGGNAADTAVILDRDGPDLLSDLEVCGWWRPVEHKQKQFLSHTEFWTSTTGLFCGELDMLGDSSVRLSSMTSKNALVLTVSNSYR